MRLITGYANRFDTYITDDGHVFVDKPYNPIKELQQESSNKGYYRVMFANQPRLVHRLVAEAYIEKPEGCNVVNHLDEDKTNNTVSNLEWTTQSGNMKHYYRDKRYKLHASLNCNAKLTESIVAEIKRRLASGDSGYAMAKEYGVSHGRIYDIKHSRGWSHV